MQLGVEIVKVLNDQGQYVTPLQDWARVSWMECKENVSVAQLFVFSDTIINSYNYKSTPPVIMACPNSGLVRFWWS